MKWFGILVMKRNEKKEMNVVFFLGNSKYFVKSHQKQCQTYQECMFEIEFHNA